MVMPKTLSGGKGGKGRKYGASLPVALMPQPKKRKPKKRSKKM